MDVKDVEAMLEQFGSDRWREISALYCFDGEASHESTNVEKQNATLKPYFRIVDLNQNDIDAKKKPAVEAGISIKF